VANPNCRFASQCIGVVADGKRHHLSISGMPKLSGQLSVICRRAAISCDSHVTHILRPSARRLSRMDTLRRAGVPLVWRLTASSRDPADDYRAGGVLGPAEPCSTPDHSRDMRTTRGTSAWSCPGEKHHRDPFAGKRDSASRNERDPQEPVVCFTKARSSSSARCASRSRPSRVQLARVQRRPITEAGCPLRSREHTNIS
jgi:hypothetical protein